MRFISGLILIAALTIPNLAMASDKEWETSAGTFSLGEKTIVVNDGDALYHEYRLTLPSGVEVVSDAFFGIDFRNIHELDGHIYVVGGFGVYEYKPEFGELDIVLEAANFGAWVDKYVVWSRNRIVYTAIPESRSTPFTGLLIWTDDDGWKFIAFDGESRLPASSVERMNDGLLIHRTPKWDSIPEPPIFYSWADETYTVQSPE